MSKIIANEEFEQAYQNKDNRRIIKYVTSKYSKQIDRDDLEDCGLQALWDCLRKHEDGRRKFTSSLYQFVNWQCLRKLEENKRFIKAVPISVLNCNGGKDNEEVYSKMEELQNEKLDDISECLQCINDEDRQILIDYYYDKMTMKQIGLKNGFSKQTVKNRLNKAINSLKRKYNK